MHRDGGAADAGYAAEIRAGAIDHTFPFDPTYGYGFDDLVAVRPPDVPDDFAFFWSSQHGAARQVATRPVLGPLETARDGVRVFQVMFNSVGDVRLGGWLAIPDGHLDIGIVVGHGYSGRGDIDWPLPLPNAAVIFPCARGLGARSRVQGIPDAAMQHVLHGIESRELYVLGGCAGDVWCAASALLELVPSIDRPLGYLGSSFGGGVGALALPWDERFGAAHLSLPSFGHFPLRLTMRCVGSGEAVRHYHSERPSVMDVLRYFDAAGAATQIEIPVQVAAALFDPAVPPPGQFAVYNAIPGSKDLIVLTAGHVEHAGDLQERQQVDEALRSFLVRHLR